jgi:pimeloyl-ACP methyl ester carboxylesterase
VADADTATSGATVTTSTETMSQLIAANESIEAANGVTFAYRRFGNTDGATLPLVFFQHYRGNLDNWDPALVDPIAERREVILFDNAGVAGSTGSVPRRTPTRSPAGSRPPSRPRRRPTINQRRFQ